MTDYGRDTWCLDSLQTGRYVHGIRRVAQRCYHRLITPQGMLRGGVDERNFGLDLSGMIGSATSPQLEAALGPRIRNELLKDPEVESVDVNVTASQSGPERSWTIKISGKAAAGPFQLVLAVSGVTLTLLKLEAA